MHVVGEEVATKPEHHVVDFRLGTVYPQEAKCQVEELVDAPTGDIGVVLVEAVDLARLHHLLAVNIGEADDGCCFAVATLTRWLDGVDVRLSVGDFKSRIESFLHLRHLIESRLVLLLGIAVFRTECTKLCFLSGFHRQCLCGFTHVSSFQGTVGDSATNYTTPTSCTFLSKQIKNVRITPCDAPDLLFC